MKKNYKIRAVLAGLLLSSSVVPVATAEDIEIYTTLGGAGSSSNPNIMFIIDTSGSMSKETWVKESYDSSKTYSGSCAANSVYFVANGKLPDCSTSTDYFDYSALVCIHAVVGYTANTYDAAGNVIAYGTEITPKQDGSLLLVGVYSDQLAQYDSVKKKWRELTIGTSAERKYIVECFSDSGMHGSSNVGPVYIDDSSTFTNTTPSDPKVPHPVWSGGAGNLQLFDANYVNYLNDGSVPLVLKSRLDQVKSAVELMVRGNTRIDMGLMQFDERWKINGKYNTEGGMVRYPILDVGADRNDFFSRLKTLDAVSWTPLSETYYEALLYFGGKPADYSLKSTPKNSVISKTLKSGGKEFRSPITSTCDKNYIVYLTDGAPTTDDLNATRKSVLTGFNGSSCSTNITSSYSDDNRDAFKSDSSTVDNCLDELAGWAATNDVAEDPAAGVAHDGVQTIVTHTIGFQLGDPDAVQLLKDTADKGKGGFFQASTEKELIDIFDRIIASTLQINTTFSSPAVSVNAFNRATHLDDLYFTLFKPGAGNHWDGNLKKYKLEFKVDPNDATKRLPFIADKNSTAAVPVAAVDDATGFFSDTAQSYWSTVVDGKEVSLGGAAGVLTTTRNVYTTTGKYTETDGVFVPSAGALISGANAVDNSNASLTNALLGITGFPDFVSGTTYRETLTNWASGLDALSQFGVADTYDDARLQLGDPLHAEPALVQYGGTLAAPDLVAYVATNDGYLHAFDADDGKEYFSFIPQELLSDLSIAMENMGGAKLYGLDGSVVAWIKDDNKDGIINGSDHVYLYVSMRRGGRNIYALDVTDRNKPVLLWVIKGGNGAYKELGDTWSTVNVEKIKDGATEKTVLVFGGGYDNSQDSATVKTKDSVGRTVYIADAATGKRLWSAGVDSAGTPTTDMEYSVPARVVPLDISGDGFIDRLYAADMGGQIFRFDINNTNGAALTSSITGGRIANLAGATDVDARRFYYPPDAALVDGKDGKYHALVIGSGFRAHPLDKTIHDRIYMIKDRDTGLTTSYTTLTEADLQDVTDNIAGGDGADDVTKQAELAKINGAEGWYIDLDDENNSGTWIGEKSLAEPLIIEGVAIVTTFTPDAPTATVSCEPSIGGGKVFLLDLVDATPAFPVNIDVRSERHQKLIRGGIPPSPNVIITKGGKPTLCIGTECQAAEFGLGVRKTYWYEVN